MLGDALAMQLHRLASDVAFTLRAGANVLCVDRGGLKAPAVAAGILMLIYGLAPRAAIAQIEGTCPGAKVAEEPPLAVGFARSEVAIGVATGRCWAGSDLGRNPADFCDKSRRPFAECQH